MALPKPEYRSKRFNPWGTEVGKAGPLAGHVHREADLHAYRNPSLQVQAPRTEQELAKVLSEMASTAQLELSQIIRKQVKLGLKTDAEFRALRDELQALAQEWLVDAMQPNMQNAVKAAYTTGKVGALTGLSSAGVTPPPGSGFQVSFSLPDRAAMAAIANDNFSDLAGQTRNMNRAAVRILRTKAAQIITKRLAQGQHPKRVARELERTLVSAGFKHTDYLKELQRLFDARNTKRNPFNGATPRRNLKTAWDATNWIANNGLMKFVDRAGDEWGLREYTEMAAHTKLMIAHNEGCRNTMRDAGVNHFIFSIHNSDCPICAPHEGQIYWTGDGDSLGFEQGPDTPLHPRCAHTILPYVIEADAA